MSLFCEASRPKCKENEQNPTFVRLDPANNFKNCQLFWLLAVVWKVYTWGPFKQTFRQFYFNALMGLRCQIKHSFFFSQKSKQFQKQLYLLFSAVLRFIFDLPVDPSLGSTDLFPLFSEGSCRTPEQWLPNKEYDTQRQTNTADVLFDILHLWTKNLPRLIFTIPMIVHIKVCLQL